MVGSLCLKAETQDAVTQCINDMHHLLSVLTLRHRLPNAAALFTQRRTRTWDLHILITAKRSHSPVLTGNTIPRITNRKLTILKLTSNIRRVIRQNLPINPPSIIDDKTLFGVDHLTNASHRSECALTVP